MIILLLSYIMNVCCVRLKYHKMHIYIYIYIYIIEWKMVEVPKKKKIYIYIYKGTVWIGRLRLQTRVFSSIFSFFFFCRSY